MTIYNETERSIYSKIGHYFPDYKNMRSETYLSVKSIKKFRDGLAVYQFPYEGYNRRTKYGDFYFLDKKKGIDMYVEISKLKAKNSVLAARLGILFGLMKNINAKQIALVLIGEGYEETSDAMNDIITNRAKDIPKDKELIIFKTEDDFTKHIKSYFSS